MPSSRPTAREVVAHSPVPPLVSAGSATASTLVGPRPQCIQRFRYATCGYGHGGAKHQARDHLQARRAAVLLVWRTFIMRPELRLQDLAVVPWGTWGRLINNLLRTMDFALSRPAPF
jgi:hypothetical protein